MATVSTPAPAPAAGFAPLHAISTEIHAASTQIGSVISSIESGAVVASHDVVTALKSAEAKLAVAASGLFTSAPIQQFIKDVEVAAEKVIASLVPAGMPVLENSLAAELPASFNPLLQAVLIATIPALMTNLLSRMPAQAPAVPAPTPSPIVQAASATP